MEEERKPNCEQEHTQRHVHTISTQVTAEDGHQHMVLTVTGTPKAEGRSHVHRITARTSFYGEPGEGHWHGVDFCTGLAQGMPDGTHIHYFNGQTSFVEDHRHLAADVTNTAPDEEATLYAMDFEEDSGLPMKHKCKYKRQVVEE